MNWYQIRPWWLSHADELAAQAARFERELRIMLNTPSRVPRRLIRGKWR